MTGCMIRSHKKVLSRAAAAGSSRKWCGAVVLEKCLVDALLPGGALRTLQDVGEEFRQLQTG